MNKINNSFDSIKHESYALLNSIIRGLQNSIDKVSLSNNKEDLKEALWDAMNELYTTIAFKRIRI